MTQQLSVNSRKKQFVNPIKINVTRRARTERILGKSPAILNEHQPPRADYPYALVTFVHISNISAVTGPILTKLFGPNFFGVISFVDQNVLGQSFFKTQNIIRAQSFRPEILLDPKIILNEKFPLYPKLSQTNNFFKHKIFLNQIFFQIFFGSKFFGPTIFFEKIFLNQNLFWP